MNDRFERLRQEACAENKPELLEWLQEYRRRTNEPILHVQLCRDLIVALFRAGSCWDLDDVTGEIKINTSELRELLNVGNVMNKEAFEPWEAQRFFRRAWTRVWIEDMAATGSVVQFMRCTYMAGNFNKVVAAVLRDLRRQAGINQTVIARAVGINQSGWSKIERGLCPVTVEHLAIVAPMLGRQPHSVVAEAFRIAFPSENSKDV